MKNSKFPCIVAPTCAGQLPSLSSDISTNHWMKVVGADDIVEVVPQIIESGAPSLAKFMFRGKNLEKFETHKSILIPHELLRSGNRYKPDPNYNNEIRGGGTTNKEAPLWTPSGKNLTTPEKYTRIAKLVNATYTQVAYE